MIRDFSPADAEAVALLEAECFSSPWSEQAILDSYSEGVLFILAEEEGRVIGYAGLQTVLDEGYITNIAVSRDFRGRGIGSSLVEQLKEKARQKGLAFISLEVRHSNAAAVALYEKQGFKTVGKRKNFYTAPLEDALIMTIEGF
ncbi:MAG: ribosomal protein S18-alanine N-acetyltransferase [Clostridia bacterium]|jgi:ribosomal-protein-alanine N-acetyltransferase|nr:ribosomal protein S18-alanine N-acetyltransferase [Clostridia bacterium]